MTTCIINYKIGLIMLITKYGKGMAQNCRGKLKLPSSVQEAISEKTTDTFALYPTK